jgi:hypothetical protein
VKKWIFAVIFCLFSSSQAFCGEVISSGVGVQEDVYFINIKIKVDIPKEKAVDIINDSEKLKKLSVFIKEVNFIKKDEDGEIKEIRTLKLCFFLCMRVIQNGSVRIEDELIEVTIPDQDNFSPSLMRLELSADVSESTVINCEIIAKPKITPRAFLVFISKGMIERKLVDVGEKIINKIENMDSDDGKTSVAIVK